MASFAHLISFRFRIAAVLSLVVLTVGCALLPGPKPLEYPRLSIPVETAEGLDVSGALPDGVRVGSGAEALRIDVTRLLDSGSSCDLLVLYPFGAPVAPCLDGLSLAASDGSSTRTLSLAEARKREGIAKAIEGRAWVEAEDVGVLRFWRLLRVRLNVSAFRAGGVSCSVREVSVRFAFDASVEAAPALAEYARSDRGFGLILDRLVANPDAAALYASRGAALPDVGEAPWRPAMDEPDARWLKTMVASDGLVRVTRETVAARLGSERAFSFGNVQVFSGGREVSTLLVDAGDGPSLVFYGQASESRYSVERAYWLRVPDASAPDAFPRRMSVSESPGPYPETVGGNSEGEFETRFEEDKDLLIQHGNFLGIKGNRWVWEEIASEHPVALTFDLVHLPPDASGDVEIEIAFHFFRYDAIDAPPPAGCPPMVVRINGAFEKQLDPFSNGDDRKRVLRVRAGDLRRQGNVMEIAYTKAFVPATPTRVYLDHVDARYRGVLIPHEGRMTFRTAAGLAWRRMAGFPTQPPLLIDITNPSWPSRIETHHLGEHLYGFYESRPERRLLALEAGAITDAPPMECAVDTGIESEENEADYLIVYHRRFEKQVSRLAAHHRSKGMVVRTVEIGEVFQKFSGGESTPEAVRDFLRHTLAVWYKPPTYVCLFGDASSDYRGELRSGVENLVPAYSWHGETGDVWASEHWYSTLSGDDDLLPDIVLGRIPARFAADADEMVRKAIAQEDGAPMGPWRGRVAFVADDSGFRRATDMVRTTLCPPHLAKPRIYVEEASYEDNFYVPRSVAEAQNLKVATGATLEMLRTLNRGVSLMVFFGHGSPNIWCDERVWFGGDSPNSDNLNLRNGDRLPFVATFTCNQGAFDYPMPAWHICVSEDMMRAREGGAGAMYVPSGPGLTAVHRNVARALMRALFSYGVRGTGEAVTLSKALYVLEGKNLETIRMYLLLGDPLVPVALPERMTPGELMWIPSGSVEEPLVFQTRTPADMPRGRYSAYLVGPDGVERGSALRRRFRNGLIQWRFAMPDDAEVGRWAVRAYYGDPGRGADGVAVAEFDWPSSLFSPKLVAGGDCVPTTTTAKPDLTASIGDPPFEPVDPLEGHTVYLHATLENRGGADAPPFRVELWEHTPDHPPVRLEPNPNLRQEQRGALAAGAVEKVRLRWDYRAFSDQSGLREVELRIDPGNAVREIDESNNSIRVPLRIRRRANVEVIEARQPGRELELMSRRTSRTTPAAIYLVVRVRNNGEDTAYMRKLGVYRREPTTPDEYVDPAIQIEEVELPPLGPGEERTYEFRWRTNVEDTKGRATAKVYRTLRSVRTSPADYVESRREW